MFTFAQCTIRAAVHAFSRGESRRAFTAASTIISCSFFHLLTDVVHFYIIILIYFLTFDTYNNKIRLWFQFVNATD